jgi:hypothetical protein
VFSCLLLREDVRNRRAIATPRRCNPDALALFDRRVFLN